MVKYFLNIIINLYLKSILFIINIMSENEESDYDSDIEGKITEEFIEVVKNWVKIDDDIREHTNAIKDLKDERKDYETYILEYMDKIKVPVIDITGGKLRVNKSQTKTPLKEESIQTALFQITKDNIKSTEMTKYIMENRPCVERINLKRTRLRKSRKKKTNANTDI